MSFLRSSGKFVSALALGALMATGVVVVETPSLNITHEAAAQDKPKKKKSQVIRNDKLAKAMNSAFEKYEAEDIPGALNDLIRKVPAMTDLNSFERSELHSFRGSMYAQMEKYPEAVREFEAMLREPDASETKLDGTRFNLAQLYMVQGDYRKALTLLENWRKTATVVRAQQEFLFCQAYLQTEDYKSALKPCQDTLTKADTEGLEKKESWVVANVVVYQQLSQFKPAIEWAKWLINNYPKTQYWKQLAGFYAQLGMEKEEFAASEAVYAQGLYTTENEVKRMAQLYQYHGAPILATKVINDGIKKEVLKRDKSILELLGGSYQLAREAQDAKAPLAAAAAAADKKDAGKLWERVAQLYIFDEEWDKAADALQKAERAGSLSNPYRTKVYEGMSLAYSGKFEAATKAFNKARRLADNEKDRRKITGWLRFVADEKRRAGEIKEYRIKPYRSR